MSWLEIIELRSAYCHSDVLKSLLQRLRDEVNREAGRQTLKAYSSFKSGADFSIHLVHSSEEAAQGGSPLGLQLAASLKEFGLVNHSIWVEMTN